MAGVLTEIRSLTGVFFSWWLGELEAMWRPLRRAFSRGPDTLSLSTSGQQWIFRLHKGSRVQELGRLDCQSQANVGRKTVGTIMKRANLRHADLTVLLAQDRTLRKRLDMPSIAEPDLRQALYFEIDRQTPFRPDDVYFDYRVLVRRPETKRVMVELTAVPRATVDKILGQVHDWGLQPSIVDVAADNAQDGVGINLLTGLEGHRLSGRWPLLSVASVLLLIGLVAAVLYIPVGQLSAMDQSLLAQVAEERDKAKQTIAKREELDQTVKAAGFLNQRKKNVPGVLVIFDALTKALPDNTWLISLSQQKTAMKISGYSSAAAELISAIEAVPLFKNPSFSSPIVQDPQNKLERFDMSFDVKASE